MAATFLSGRPLTDLRPLLRFFNHISYPTWLRLEDAVRSGQAQSRQGRFTEAEQRIFSEGVEALTAGTAQALATTYDFGRHHRILDLGGGTGSFLLAILRQNGGLEATLFEMPAAAAVAQERLSGVSTGRTIQIRAGDFFSDPLPDGHDVVLMANVVHLFLPERNGELLRRIRTHVSEEARLLLVDFWTDPTHPQPLAATLLAGEFLVIAGEGDVYSVEEVQSWLEETGWRTVEHKPLAGPASLIMAEAG